MCRFGNPNDKQQTSAAIADGNDPCCAGHGGASSDFVMESPASVSRVHIFGVANCRYRNSVLSLCPREGRLTRNFFLVGNSLTRRIGVRVRKNGANEDRTTGNLVLAVYQHDTSRELDPQLHTHAVAANLCYDGTEGCWKALQASGIYERAAYLTEVYRNALARMVRALGYEIDNRRDAKGRDAGFEIRGISEVLAAKYSQRSRQRDKAIQQFVRQNGREPTVNEIAVLIRESRAEKLIEVSTVRSPEAAMRPPYIGREKRNRAIEVELSRAGNRCGVRTALSRLRKGPYLRTRIGRT